MSLTSHSDWPQSGVRQSDGRRYASDVHSVPLPDYSSVVICQRCQSPMLSHVRDDAVKAIMEAHARQLMERARSGGLMEETFRYALEHNPCFLLTGYGASITSNGTGISLNLFELMKGENNG